MSDLGRGDSGLEHRRGCVLFISALCGLILLIGVGYLLLQWQPLGQNRGRDDLDRQIRSLLILCDNGGSLKVHARRGDVYFEVRRVGGSEHQVTIALCVPKTKWSETYASDIGRRFVENGLEVLKAEEAGSDCFLNVAVTVIDIWDAAAGEGGTRAVNLLLDAGEVSRDERLDFQLVGPRIRRKWPDHQ